MCACFVPLLHTWKVGGCALFYAWAQDQETGFSGHEFVDQVSACASNDSDEDVWSTVRSLAGRARIVIPFHQVLFSENVSPLCETCRLG